MDSEVHVEPVEHLLDGTCELKVKIKMSGDAFAIVEANAHECQKSAEEYVAKFLEPLLAQRMPRSPEEALRLTRAFFEANKEWLQPTG